MEIVTFESFAKRYSATRIRNWMCPVMGDVRFKPETVLMMDNHTDFYTVPLEWRKENMGGAIGTNPALEFVPPVVYFQKASDALLWYMTWGLKD